jgi:hypothetical protein
MPHPEPGALGTVACVRRYVEEANGRWVGFDHRPGDIVISTRSKCGTTWLQMVCALLVFQDRDLPAPLGELSPWLDWEVEPIAEVVARLDRQDHRRFIKTHTPLAGLPLDPQVTYVVAGRHPLDVAESLFAHGHNIDRTRFEELTGRASHPPIGSFDEWLDWWIEPGVGPDVVLDSLPGLVHHVDDAWRLRDEGTVDVVLVHYDDLTADLDGEMRRLADHLGIAVPEDRWPSLVDAATFDSMRARAEDLAPDRVGVLRSRTAFFRMATSERGGDRIPASTKQRVDDTVRSQTDRAIASWLLR